MENISGVSSSSSSSMDYSLIFDEFEFVEEIECLSNWELLDADSEMYGPEEEEGEDEIRFSPVVSVPVSLTEDEIKDRIDIDVYLIQNQNDDFNGDRHRDGDDDDVAEEDEISDEEQEYGLDDELVPWSVSNKFGRERMRKLGKRAFSKMNNSKKSPFLFTKPGCVRGKHGMGMKHSY